MITEKQDFARQRAQMILNQIKERGIHDPAILAALDAVPRAAFISEAYWPYTYEDIPLPLPAGQTISQAISLRYQVRSSGCPSPQTTSSGASPTHAASMPCSASRALKRDTERE